MAAERSVAPEAIAIAWLPTHPAGIQPILGTTRPERIRAAAQAERVALGRKDWCALCAAAHGSPLP
jgi:predicted oxidoreductase